MQRSFSGLDLFVLRAVAIVLKNFVSTPLVAIAPQELGDFEFDGFLKHELNAQADAFRQWRLPGGGLRNCSSSVWLGSWRFILSFAFCFTGALGVCTQLLFTGSLGHHLSCF